MLNKSFGLCKSLGNYAEAFCVEGANSDFQGAMPRKTQIVRFCV